MKNLYITFLLVLASITMVAQQAPFITTWQVTAGDLGITIPTTGTGYNYTVDFGDGTVQTGLAGNVTHTYSIPGIYTVSIGGDFPGLYFSNKKQLKSVEQWGDINWQELSHSFDGCSNLVVNATDAPNLSDVTDMSGMFRKCYSFNQSINHWDVSGVTIMDFLFNEAYSFNQPLNNWDVSNVQGMNAMFGDAHSFNQPLDKWDVLNVDDFKNMFRVTNAFNQDLSNWEINSSNLMGFISSSGLDVSNYESLLTRLAQLGLKNGYLDAYGLKYCNQGARNYLRNVLNWEVKSDTISHDCQFKNVIQGKILYDEDVNGCDPNDVGVFGFMVNANDGTNYYSTFTDDGNYSIGTFHTNLTVSVINTPNYVTSNPASTNVTFTNSNIEVVDFCITKTLEVEDLTISLLSISEARPGFPAKYRLIVGNLGTNTVGNVTVSLIFDNTMQSFLSSNPIPNAILNNELQFNILNFPPFGRKKIIDFTMLTFAPPIVQGGDTLSFVANVTPTENDYTPSDNTYEIEQMVINSYDPNDKQVMQGEEIYLDQAAGYLDYIIRFQNTGTASAINVRILDTLHPKLDWNTIQPINASHDYRIKISKGNEVEFIFDNIHLPDETTNEPDSHGFVAYRIKPKSNVQVGDVITGDASIFFDYNLPIITNTVSTKIIDNIVGIADNSVLADQIKIYPNPTDKTLNILLTDQFQLEELLIYNLQGQQMQKSKEKTVDVGNLSGGVYFLKIITNQGTVNRRFVKI